MKIIDLFCGTGGFSRGFEDASGFEVGFGIDVLETSVETFRLNHPHALGLATDVRTFTPARAGDELDLAPGYVDLIVGGPPCQGFSSIRPHRSSDADDPRNSLFEEFARYVEHFRPRMFVLENVVGLATHKQGKTLALTQEAFDRVGYDTDWRILNAAHFGVPQKRERLIVIGAERGGPLSFPDPTHHSESVGRTIGFRDRSRMLGAGLSSQPSLFDGPTEPIPLLPAVTVADAIDDLPAIAGGESAAVYDRPARTVFQTDRRKGLRQLALHESTRHTDRMLEIIRHSGPNISSIPGGLITSGFSSSYSRLAGDEPSVTITVNFVHPASNRCIHPTLDRALTPREGARLQSFDDDFRFAGNRAQLTKQIGNAVPPLLGKAIGTHLASLINGSDVETSRRAA